MSGPDAGGRPGALPATARRARVAALGEGMLEVGVHPDLDDGVLARGYGGDAANVAVMAARLGAATRLVTRVGDDAPGRLLLGFWQRHGVDTSAVGVDGEAPTGLYVNELDGGGAHRFSYYRTGSAASLMRAADVDGPALDGLDVLHVTGVTLAISATAADAAEAAVDRARATGAAVSFGGNVRPHLRPDRERLAALALRADVLLVSLEDGRWLFGASDAAGIVAALGRSPTELVVTQGDGPALLVADGEVVELRPPRIELVDTAGAGDALAGAYLARRFSGSSPRDALAAGVAAAALSCQAAGCSLGYPSAAAVTQLAAALRERAGVRVS